MSRQSWPLFTSIVVLFVLGRSAPATAGDDPVARADLDTIVQPLIDDEWLFGVAIGIVNERGGMSYGYGRVSKADPRPPDGETVFEIASITKVLTGVILAQAVEAGEVRLDEPVQELLPASVTMPKYEGREITLVDLATHTSGLPRLPANLKFTDPADPYSDYTVDNMYEFLKTHELRRAVGAEHEYSNLGVGLLGHVLALRAKQSYEELMLAKIAQPLGMVSTRVVLTDSMRRRLAEPHDAEGNAVKNWDIPTFAGAGGLRSTVDDMRRFVAAALGIGDCPFASAMKMSQHEYYENRDGRTGMGLGWQINKPQGLYWHNGETGGYRTYMAVKPAAHAGVIVLSNTSVDRVIDQLGYHLLALAAGGLPKPLDLPRPVKLDEQALSDISGTYIAGRRTMTIAAANGDLLLKSRRQRTRKLLAESPDNFFLRAGGTAVFHRDDEGHVTGATFDLSGQTIEAEKQPAED